MDVCDRTAVGVCYLAELLAELVWIVPVEVSDIENEIFAGVDNLPFAIESPLVSMISVAVGPIRSDEDLGDGLSERNMSGVDYHKRI